MLGHGTLRFRDRITHKLTKNLQQEFYYITKLGRSQEAMIYLKTQVTVSNSTKHQKLLTYLDKHQAEIIDYERGKQAGKPIGSGRMEKAVDQVIGLRQKHKGMSWRPQSTGTQWRLA
jgi:hypothetical protein